MVRLTKGSTIIESKNSSVGSGSWTNWTNSITVLGTYKVTGYLIYEVRNMKDMTLVATLEASSAENVTVTVQ